MTYSAFPPKHSDYVEYEELRRLEAENRELIEEQLEQQFERDITEFRSDVMAKLFRHGALENSQGWAMFHTDYYSGDDGDTAVYDTELVKNVLILCETSLTPTWPGSGTYMPHIRMFVNELLPYQKDKNDEDGKNENAKKVADTDDSENELSYAWLTQDVVVDESGDCQHFVDAFIPEKEDLLKSKSVIFLADGEGGYMLSKNFQSFTPIVKLSPDDEPVVKPTDIVPLGVYMDIRDRMDALAVARQLLAEVMELEPADFQGNKQDNY